MQTIDWRTKKHYIECKELIWTNKMKRFTGFIEFIREQGVVGLAIGFILGGAVSKMVSSLVKDILNPLIGLLLGKVELAGMSVQIGSSSITYGNFISNLIDFSLIALVVYIGYKILRLDRLSKKKD